MITPPTGTPLAHDDHPDTSVASRSDLGTVLPDFVPPVVSVEDVSATQLHSSYQSPSSSESRSSHLLRPIPTPSVNASQASFAFPETAGDDNDGSGLFDPLSPEIASADICIAPDGSFVETSSGPAARELKRRYDQHIGVGKEVRSPYAITAFVNQHGKQMYRVGHRELSAPAASAAETAELVVTKGSINTRTKRRSRMSVHGLIPPSLFKSGGGQSLFSQQPAPGPRKLVRRTRSIPDMHSSTLFKPQSAQPSTSTAGRTHSQSVTSSDMPRLPSSVIDISRQRNGDIFGDVMCWCLPPSPQSTSFSTQSLPGEASTISFEHAQTPAIIVHPFGPSVSFDSPSRKPVHEYLSTPRHLREMQSFESGLTARQTDPDPETISGPGESKSPSPIEPSDSSFRSISPPPRFVGSLDIKAPSSPPFGPTLETSMHSRYSTDVFDILQTYRGLPLLDKLSPDSGETTVIKMSLGSDETAAPRDDPRFVIWGEIPSLIDNDGFSISQGSLTDRSTSAHSSSASRRKSGRRKRFSDVPQVKVSVGENMRKILVAATIERWIAQLTSDLNYDELLIFFLTYRTYISSVDLCHLLICRFHWALGKASSKQDETVRRIVRVRTFVAIRYWLLTFFGVDFLPNRELRMLLASWLNTLIRDPVLKRHSDGLSTVRKLSKIVKDCKKVHTRTSDKHASAKPKPKRNHVLGDKFAEAIGQEEDSDIDLDFGADEGSLETASFQTDPVNAHLTSVHVGAGLSAGPIPATLPISQRSRRSSTARHEVETTFVQTPATLPIHHNSLTRAFTKTIGRLGRWRRVLNSRSPTRSPISACADVSAFDVELTASRDLLSVHGGVEQYLKMIEQQQATTVSPTREVAISSAPLADYASSIAASSTFTDCATLDSHDEPTVPAVDQVLDISPENIQVEAENAEAESRDVESVEVNNIVSESQSVEANPAETVPVEVESDSDEDVLSSRSSSTDSLGVPVSSRFMRTSAEEPSQRPPWRFDVVSIDELDLSDTSSDHHVGGPAAPPGLRKEIRKLPLRRDFEFVQRESVSSMGINSHQSVASSALSGSSAGGGGLGNIAQWQMNALVDSLSNEEESGDVEDALRRLEGQINPVKQQEKASKVDGWVKSIRERMAAGDYGDEHPRFYNNEDEAEEQSPDEMAGVEDDDNDGENMAPSRSSGYIEDTMASAASVSGSRSSQELIPPASESVHTPVATSQVPYSTTGTISPLRSGDARPAPEDAVPMEILQSRVPSHPLSHSGANPPPAKFAHPDVPKVHRSFILSYRAETLVEHFSMIDRELFMGVKFEELVLDDWMSCEEVNVLDWVQFLKDRARWKAEHRWSQKTSALGAVRARFNLIANFTLSEVVLSPPHDRHIVVGKFIRIAWKAYCLNNFNTLVAVMAGLHSEWVTKAMRRHWTRVGIWETRMFKDLTEWNNYTDDFKFMRIAIDQMVDAKPLDVGSHASVISTGGTDDHSGRGRATSESRASPSTACIPFIGVYLSQLYRYNKLPDLIDPTAPNEAVSVDPVSANFDAPAHPEVFSALAPLPPSIQLEPLINVHKQRLIAGVIKSLVAGQHLASRVHFPVDKRLFQRCLRLHGLDTDTLQRALDHVS